jgi:alpha-L-fucosidase 2
VHFRPERRFGLTLLRPCTATLTGGSGWSAAVALAVAPCVVPSAATPLVAWDPSSGTTVADVCGHGRDAGVIGPAAHDADGGLVLGESTYLTTAPTMLGFLREATFAARVRVAAPSGYRLFPRHRRRARRSDPGQQGVFHRRRAQRRHPTPSCRRGDTSTWWSR